ncbi:MAG: ATPase, T2SS/T4P/T4SS family [Candidatus Falkowbacteria bacterium]
MADDSMLKKNLRLLDFLVSKGALTQELAQGVRTELEAGGKKDLELMLTESNLIKMEDFVKTKAEYLNLPYINLSETEIPDEVLNSIPPEVAEHYKVVCFEKQAKQMSIGMVDPENFRAIEAIDFLAIKNSLQVEYYLISQVSFTNSYRQYQRFNKEVVSALKQKEEEERIDLEKDTGPKEDISFEDIVKNAPVAKIVNEIIKHAVEMGASDIHIEPLEKESRVRYRIDGILHTSLTLPKNIHDSILARIKVLSKLKLDETRVPQGGRIRMTVEGKDVDFRVSTLPLMGEEKVVMRVLDTSKGVLSLEQLGFAGEHLTIVARNIKKTVGIILVTGPTGSGKSTTLYTILHNLNGDNVNIVTLEDPVEYFIKGVNQSQIRPEIGFTFAAGLRSLLRQDPDIMMVGEIRDNETSELAIHAALTGHLVLSTLHTNDAIGAVPRLLDMGIEPFLLGSVLNMVIAQRLTRRLCPFCRKSSDIPEAMLGDIQKQLADVAPDLLKKSWPDYDPAAKLQFFEPVGCVRCNRTGYKGRAVIAEILEIDEYIKDIIINHKGVLSEADVRAHQPFMNVMQDGLIKALQGVTSLQETYRVMND